MKEMSRLFQKNTKAPTGNFPMGAFCAGTLFVLALSGCFGLFLALYAGLFIVFTTTYFGQDAAAGSLALEPLKSTFQGLVFTYANFHQFPSPLNAT